MCVSVEWLWKKGGLAGPALAAPADNAIEPGHMHAHVGSKPLFAKASVCVMHPCCIPPGPLIHPMTSHMRTWNYPVA